jgi:hypothetical protein
MQNALVDFSVWCEVVFFLSTGLDFCRVNADFGMIPNVSFCFLFFAVQVGMGKCCGNIFHEGSNLPSWYLWALSFIRIFYPGGERPRRLFGWR